MARDDEEAWTQLATRIPKELHRRMRLHCVTNDVTVMEFVIRAVKEKLARDKNRRVSA